MSVNPIAGRIFQFLKKFPPYDRIEDEALDELCRTSSLVHYTEGDIIFHAGSPINPYVYVLYKGLVHLKWPGSQMVFDSAEPGETFGIRAAFSGNPYVLTAETAMESLVITLDLELFRMLLNTRAAFSAFFASGLASGTLPQSHHWDSIDSYKAGGSVDTAAIEELLDADKQPVTCMPDVSVPDLAQAMIDHHVGSVIVTDPEQRPVGIVTDKDIRRLVAQRLDPGRLSAADIMSRPVVTVAPDRLWTDAFITMAEHGIRHLAVTSDGTPGSQVVAVISEHDLLRRTSMQMLSILKKIKSAPDIGVLSRLREEAEERITKFVQSDLPIHKVSALANQVNDLTIRRVIGLAIQETHMDITLPPSNRWCWLALGSYGRKEQIIRTDQDNALIYEGSDVFRPHYLEIASRINDYLEKCGYEKCPAEVMASNPKWCLSLNEWKKTFTRWIEQPDPKAVMHTTIFFDFRPIYGSDALTKALARHISDEISKDKKFLTYLAANALSAPPAFTFFKSVAVEDSGPHKGYFDLKARALAPYADVARLLAIYHGFWNSPETTTRYLAVAELEPHYSDLLQDAAKAYNWLLKIRIKNAIANGSGGRWLAKSFLSPLERQILKKALMPLQELQSIVETRFQTQFLRV
ncbi:MAG: DUF294 nucleotidyltransferase-like domain-containing protein [Thermaurantimonas sp.]